jgi:hypothetical protein
VLGGVCLDLELILLPPHEWLLVNGEVACRRNYFLFRFYCNLVRFITVSVARI